MKNKLYLQREWTRNGYWILYVTEHNSVPLRFVTNSEIPYHGDRITEIARELTNCEFAQDIGLIPKLLELSPVC
jgi:hypothetical protein